MFNRLSFKAKLRIALSILALTSLLTSGYLSYQLIHIGTDDKTDLLKKAAESIADKVDRNLFERYGDVQAFALSEPARSGDTTRITKFMVDMMAAYAPIYDVMLVLDKKGNVLAANSVDKSGKSLDPKKIIGKNYAQEEWFKDSINGKIAPGTAHFTDLLQDPDTAAFASTDGKVMNFTAPIRDAKTGEILGVWTNRMSWKDVVEDIVIKESQKLKDEKITTISAYLVNQDGTYLIHHDESQVLKTRSEGLAQFLSQKISTWSHSIEDQDQIKNEALEIFTSAKGYSTYPAQKWTYILRAPSSDSTLRFNFISSIVGMVLILLMAFFANSISNRVAYTLEQIIQKLKDGSSKVSQTSAEVTQAAQTLSGASTQQAAALQETTAAIEEINAMIKKSSDNSTHSMGVAEQSAEIAKRGQESVEQMSAAINEINISNEAILNQINESNDQISNIATVIAEIGDKTKVINDIVFQTKLLSFNASVEAARAGEHGKGFAVVAEEVGNLAQMSGNAAKEISEMLDESIRKVKDIVTISTQKVEVLVDDGRKKVKSGIVIVDECGSILNEVVKNVDDLKNMVSEISVASQEQSQGVNEITKAMNELDKTNNENTTTSHQVSGFALSLSEESVQMDEVVTELGAIVTGAQGPTSAPSKPVSHEA